METTLHVADPADLDASPLFRRLRDLTVDVLELDSGQVRPDARFAEELGADSLDLVELVEAIEAEFDVRIGDDELAEITTVGEAYSLLSGKLA